jgi:hypothetical protein
MFSREYLIDELELPHSDASVKREVIDQRRWVTVYSLIFCTPDQVDGTAWETTYEQGSTEMQETRLWEDEPLVECTLVHEKEVTTKQWVPVEEGKLEPECPECQGTGIVQVMQYDAGGAIGPEEEDCLRCRLVEGRE